MQESGINVLMYHSISEGEGPTTFSPNLFRGHLESLADSGYTAISLATLLAWQLGEAELPPRPVVLTFDDGFADFMTNAFPVIHALGWNATVFLPTGKIGARADWKGAALPPQPLMSWSQIRELSQENIDFGGHSVSHADLTLLSADDLRREVADSVAELEQQIGKACRSFAPPYGNCNQLVREVIGEFCDVSVGTRLARVSPDDDRFNLPRIEMHYFRDLGRWRSYLEGRGEFYLTSRAVIRRVRHFVEKFIH